MRTVLVDEVQVERYTLLAEMASLERRSELGVICRRARDSRADITETLIEEVLPGLTRVGYGNVRRWCVDLGLCDGSGSLTRLGHDVADTGSAPVPEQGVYDLWIGYHPVLGGSRVLHVERVTHSAAYLDHKEVVPPPVEPDPGHVIASVIEPTRRFIIRDLPSHNERPAVVQGEARARCHVRWTLDWDSQASELSLTGAIHTNIRERPMVHDPEHVDIDLWRLVADWALGPLQEHGRWSVGERRLAVPFEGLPEAEQESFACDVHLDEVEVRGRGRWSDVLLSGVPIAPASADDAQRWAMARLDRRLRADGHRHTRAAVRRLFAGVADVPALAPHCPTLPGNDALLAEYAEDAEMFWRLAAPVDLSPLKPLPAELGPVRVGDSQSGDVLHETATAVWLSHGSRLSMGELLDRLTGPGPAGRLLLVDRYVRGEQNLASLALLAATLAERDTALDVWTGDDVDAASLAAIQRIIGHAPERRPDLFAGYRRLHGRYLAVVPLLDAPFGWHMSNGVLDPRVAEGDGPATPLSWRDLAATRLPVEQLPPPIAAWANGAAR